MTTVDRARASAINATVDKIRHIEHEHGVTRESLAQIKTELLNLAAQAELFPQQDFPPATDDDPRNSCLYRIAEDPDHRFALYVNSSHARYDTPAHNHTTWAVIVGIRGDEHNRFYRRDDEKGVEQAGGDLVTTGTGVAFLPDDLHSIHMTGDEWVINFHMYGTALEQLHKREYYSDKDHEWRVFPAHSDIREARPDYSEATA